MLLISKVIKNIFQKYPTPFVRLLVSSEDRLERSPSEKLKNILIQVVPDDCYFGLMYGISCDLDTNTRNNVSLLVTRGMNASIGISPISILKRLNFSNYFYMKKWVTQYNVPQNRVYWAAQVNYFNKLRYLAKSLKIWWNWYQRSKTEKDRSKLYFENIRIDDLIIDTYLRYRPSSQFKVGSLFVLFLLRDALCQINNLNELFRSSNFSAYLTSYASYTTHGVPVRVALANKVKVYSFGDLGAFGSELTQQFPYHLFNPDLTRNDNTVYQQEHEKYKSIASKTLKFRFSGGMDPSISYMKRSSYLKDQKIETETDFKGYAILFLHDFFDSPNIYDNFIFEDFYKWAVFTIEFLKKNNIKFAIKPHPNQIRESEIVTKFLQKKYQELTWIDPKINNLQIIKDKPRVGITVYGTVASELAYFGIPSICCADHPHQYFNFCNTAYDISGYKRILMGISDIKTHPRKKVSYRREAINYFIARNSLKNIDKVQINNQYAKYWNISKNSKNRNELHIKFELQTLRNVPEYKGFIEELTYDV